MCLIILFKTISICLKMYYNTYILTKRENNMQTYRVVILQDCIESINEIVSAIDGFAGFTVVGSSCDGEEGLELISKLNPDFILMGIVLKNFDGLPLWKNCVICRMREIS